MIGFYTRDKHYACFYIGGRVSVHYYRCGHFCKWRREMGRCCNCVANRTPCKICRVQDNLAIPFPLR